MFSAPQQPQIQPAIRPDSTSLARRVEELPVELEIRLRIRVAAVCLGWSGLGFQLVSFVALLVAHASSLVHRHSCTLDGEVVPNLPPGRLRTWPRSERCGSRADS